MWKDHKRSSIAKRKAVYSGATPTKFEHPIRKKRVAIRKRQD